MVCLTLILSIVRSERKFVIRTLNQNSYVHVTNYMFKTIPFRECLSPLSDRLLSTLIESYLKMMQ